MTPGIARRQLADDARDVGQVDGVVQDDDAGLQGQRALPVAADDGLGVAAVDEHEVGLPARRDQRVEHRVRLAEPVVDEGGEGGDEAARPPRGCAASPSPNVARPSGRSIVVSRGAVDRASVGERGRHHQRADARAGADLDDRSRRRQPHQRAEERVLLRRAGVAPAEVERRDLRDVEHRVRRQARPARAAASATQVR